MTHQTESMSAVQRSRARLLRPSATPPSKPSCPQSRAELGCTIFYPDVGCSPLPSPETIQEPTSTAAYRVLGSAILAKSSQYAQIITS